MVPGTGDPKHVAHRESTDYTITRVEVDAGSVHFVRWNKTSINVSRFTLMYV